VLELFKYIQTSELSRFIGGQNHLFGAVFQLIHIVGLILILSPVTLVSLRLVGLGGLREQSLVEIAKSTEKLIWVGLGLLVFSGIFIFIPAATNYYPNFAFWTKFSFLAVAIFVHITLYKKFTAIESPPLFAARATAGLVMFLWLAVAFSARFIGFV
jgi:hypothetical protein